MSEEIKIPYFNPVKRKPANYYPDFYIELTDKNGNKRKEMIEVKPSTQVQVQLKENTYAKLQRAVNYAKWEAAAQWCVARGINFRIIDEKSIFGTNKK